MDIREVHKQFCDYQATMKGFLPDTIDTYQSSLKIFLKLMPHIQHVEQVSEMEAQQFFYLGRTKRNWKPITFVSYHKGLNVFYKWLVKNNYAASNPFEGIEKPRLEKKLPTRLSKQQAKDLLETVRCMPCAHPMIRARNYAIFSMFLYCGLRKGELLRLKLVDVDLLTMVIAIHQGKGNKDRVVPIPYQLRPALETYINERIKLHKLCDYFFVSFTTDRNFGQDGFKHLVEEVKKASKIYFYPHMLRHTFATLMLEGGCDIYALSKMMGHSDIKTTTIYLSASVEHMRSQITKHPLSL